MEPAENKTKSYSVIIPVLSEDKIPALSPLFDVLSMQSLAPDEIHLVIGDDRQGRAINFGVQKSSTKYVATLDDDTEIDDPRLFEKLIDCISSDPSIGLLGAACEIPNYASNFQKRAMKEIPRRYFPKQKHHIDSDMVQHPCLLAEKKLFLDLGGENEDMIRGLDPYLRKKFRDAGKRVVIAADTWVYHILPDSFSRLVKMYYRNGRGSAFAKMHYPSNIIELTDGYDNAKFIEKRSFIYRVFRRMFGVFASLIRLRFIKFATDIAYTLGYTSELLNPGYLTCSQIENIKTELSDYKSIKIYKHFVKLDDKNEDKKATQQNKTGRK